MHVTGAVLYRFRAEARIRWRSWLGIAVLVGLSSAAVLALAAGARRTDSVYARFLDAQRAYDVVVINNAEDGTAVFDFDELAQLPEVADSARGGYFFAELGDGVPAIASSGDGFGTDLNRFNIVEGRTADPDDPDEVVVAFELADAHDLGLGDEIPVFDPDTILEEIESAPPEAVPPEERAELLELYREAIEVLPDGEVTVVGIEASPGEFPPSLLPVGALHPRLRPAGRSQRGGRGAGRATGERRERRPGVPKRSRPEAAVRASRSPPRRITPET